MQTMARSLIETIVRSKLNDLKNSPERTLRNLVDLALLILSACVPRNKEYRQRSFDTIRNEFGI